jgi:hypothetical protein
MCLAEHNTYTCIPRPSYIHPWDSRCITGSLSLPNLAQTAGLKWLKAEGVVQWGASQYVLFTRYYWVIRLKRFKWAGRVWIIMHTLLLFYYFFFFFFFVGEPEKRPGRRWEENIKVIFSKLDVKMWTKLIAAQLSTDSRPEVSGGRTRWYSDELHNMFSSINIIRMINKGDLNGRGMCN